MPTSLLLSVYNYIYKIHNAHNIAIGNLLRLLIIFYSIISIENRIGGLSRCAAVLARAIEWAPTYHGREPADWLQPRLHH